MKGSGVCVSSPPLAHSLERRVQGANVAVVQGDAMGLEKESFQARLEAAGFRDMKIEAAKQAFRFRARRA